MTTWNTLRLDRQKATPLTITADFKEKKKKTESSEVFCFLPAHDKHICKATRTNAQPKLCKRDHPCLPDNS